MGSENNKDLVLVDIKKIVPTPMEYAILIGNEEKCFIISVGLDVGAAISMFVNHIEKPRPLTHDLIGNIFLGLGIAVDKVVVNDLKENTFYARLLLKEENELGKKIIEIDARPSDCIAIAKQQNCPIYVTRQVFDAVDDATNLFKPEGESESEGEEEEGL